MSEQNKEFTELKERLEKSLEIALVFVLQSYIKYDNASIATSKALQEWIKRTPITIDYDEAIKQREYESMRFFSDAVHLSTLLRTAKNEGLKINITVEKSTDEQK